MRGGQQPAFHPADADASSTGQVRILWNKRQLPLEVVTMPRLAEFLDQVLGDPVLDRTGLSGRFDYTPESADPDSPDPKVDLASSVLDFLQELRLTADQRSSRNFSDRWCGKAVAELT